jgi:hypothetical protein
MSRAGELGTVLVQAEASWGEASTSFASGIALATLGPVDLSGIRHTRAPSNRTMQGLNEGLVGVLGVHEVNFTTRHYLPGHGSAAATTQTDLAKLLAYVLGNAIPGIAATTEQVGGASTVTSVATTVANGGTAGGLAHIGVKGDGRGDGRSAAFSAHAGNVLTLLTALAAAPIDGDAITFCEMMYPSDGVADTGPGGSGIGPGAGITSLRFRLMTANLQIVAHGCVATALRIDTPIGGRPTFEVDWTGSWFEHVAATYPDTTAKQDYMPAPISGGEFWINTVVAGVPTTTRQVKTVKAVRITYDLGIELKKASGGVSAYQEIIGATRTWRDPPGTVEIEFDSELATTTPADGGSDTIYDHALWCLSGAAAGQRVSFYWPQLCRVENVAPQVGGKVNNKRVMFYMHTGPTTTTELTKSCMRIGFN